MSKSFIKKPGNGPHTALDGLGVLAAERQHVDVVVQDRNQAYSASYRGVRASSTGGAMIAAERLAEKLFGPGAAAVSLPPDPDDANGVTRWRLQPRGDS